MSGIKTLVNEIPVDDCIAGISDEVKKSEANELLKIFKQATGMEPKMWGSSIVGYGMYHYKSEKSRQEGDWPLVGFSIRKSAISIYIMPGFNDYSELLAKLGKHKTSVGCLYINKLTDVHVAVLTKLIIRALDDMKKKYPDSKST
jgi:hypothetical protein